MRWTNLLALSLGALAACAPPSASLDDATGDALSSPLPARGDAGDAGDPTLVATDTSTPTPRCTPGRAFSSITEVPGSVNAQPINAGLALSQDESTIYFTPWQKPGMARAHRASRIDAFDAPEAIVLGANEWGFDPYLSLDGTTLFFSRGGGATGRIGRAVIAGGAVSVSVDDLPSDTAVATPFFDVPNNVFYGVGYMLPSHELGTVVDGRFQATAALRIPAGDGTTLATRSPVLSVDGLFLYFAATVTPPGGTARQVVYLAKRSAPRAEWQTPTPVAGLTSSAWVPGWLSPDSCRLYLTNIVQEGWKAYVATISL